MEYPFVIDVMIEDHLVDLDDRIRPESNKRLFLLGRLKATETVHWYTSPEKLRQYLGRHASGDWGQVCAADKKANDHALKVGTRLISSYPLEDGLLPATSDKKLWIITEADRSVTTFLYPSEY